MSGGFVVIAGNPGDGFVYYGAFKTADEANGWAERNRKELFGNGEYWIFPLLVEA